MIWAGGITAAGTLTDSLEGRGGRAGERSSARTCAWSVLTNVWCVGDAAAIPSGVDAYYPQLAPVAIQSGHHCGGQILRLVAGEATEPFSYHDKGIMATIGRRAAVAKLPHGTGDHRHGSGGSPGWGCTCGTSWAFAIACG